MMVNTKSGNLLDSLFEEKVPTGLAIEVIKITPEMAEELLSTQQPNRILNERRIAAYAAMMKDGDWKIADPIKIDINGRLYDGQHRLHGVVKANVVVEFTVIRGMPEHAKKYCDLGQTRTAAQIAQIAGLNITKQHLSIPRQWLAYHSFNPISNHKALFRLYLKYEKGIEFAVRNYKRSSGSNSSPDVTGVRCAIAKAYYYENHARLLEFMEVFATRFPNPTSGDSDYAALALRNFVESITKGSGTVAKKTPKEEIYWRGCRCIDLFCKSIGVKKLYNNGKFDFYPLPDFLKGREEDISRSKKRINRNMMIEVQDPDMSFFDAN
ncbi:MAG: hypothetical protein KME60_03395 [Cyanomargarita calcarea GSE-NOS-MK-12-04C]|jgi:hypothetical protein|uniref:ParB/Sulfiredoxin domain-containing protein n=1 Tax=Cyanomargarita calcarea GSE-NOS-MK-12-04C TaxID=2839659 RepID=A0A951QIH8_9CYAN|nr:hypothetical protein [Cyanomargarita calcarea GSE-NOS-MK-12-04C]